MGAPALFAVWFDITSALKCLLLQVKNKKRWSQVMYMSYVLDLKEKIMEGMNTEPSQ